MKEIQFTYVGALPASDKPWHLKTGGGYVWFVNEDHPPMYLADDGLHVVVRAEEYPDAPMILPRAYE